MHLVPFHLDTIWRIRKIFLKIDTFTYIRNIFNPMYFTIIIFYWYINLEQFYIIIIAKCSLVIFAFNSVPLLLLLSSTSVMDFKRIYLWEDPLRTLPIFSIVLVILIFVCYYNLISIFSCIGLMMLVAMSVIKVYSFLMTRVVKKNFSEPLHYIMGNLDVNKILSPIRLWL